MILEYSNIQEAVETSVRKASAITVGENRILCRVLGRWKMFVDARDVSYTPRLAMDGIMNPHVVEALCGAIKPGMVVADVGACFGYSTLLAGELVTETGRVYAFEPNPRAFHILKQNVELNEFRDIIRWYPMAVGDAVGTGQLTIHKRRFCSATMAPKAISSSNSETSESVQIFTLDYTMGQNRTSPDFVILSTSGYEQQVWNGMKGIMNSRRKMGIYMDFTPRWYADPDKFAAEILDFGFMVNRIHRDGTLEPLTNADSFMGQFCSPLMLNR